MADIGFTERNIAPVTDVPVKMKFFRAGEAITRGQLVRLDADGLVRLGSNAAPYDLVGVAMSTVLAGDVTSVMLEGTLSGYAIAGVANGAVLYISATPGSFNDAAPGTGIRPIGTVMPLTDRPASKVLYVSITPFG